MAKFTRRREQELGRDTSGRTATLEWDAYPFDSAPDVESDPAFPVSINAVYPEDPASKLRCDRFTTRRRGGRLWLVTASWSIPPDGKPEFFGESDEDDPLSAPTEIRWENIQATEEVDRDTSGNPIVNSARKGFSSNISKVVNAKRVTFSRNEASFNVNTALFYENTVNSATFQGGQPGEVRCISITPTSVTTVNANYVNVAYVFEYRSISIWGNDPHQPRILDQGYEAAFTVDGSTRVLRLVDTQGQPPESEVLLDGHGRPISQDDYTYLKRVKDNESDDESDEKYIAEDSPTYADMGTPDGSYLEPLTDAVFLRYARYPARDFNALNLP